MEYVNGVADHESVIRLLVDLFEQLWWTNLRSWKARRDYLQRLPSMDPLWHGLILYAFFTIYSYVSSVITCNVSQVDRMWSIIPVIYAVFFAVHPILINWFTKKNAVQVTDIDDRLVLMAVLAFIWGARLTFNAFRRGYYKWGHEDYRWHKVRRAVPWPIFQLFNFVFIAAIQNAVLFLIVTPAYIASNARALVPLNWIDYLACGLVLLCVIGETIADQQQWNYHSKKHSIALEERTGEYKVGFNRSGLFRYSRHPNYFFELATWYSFYLFSVAVSRQWINWTLLGPLTLTAIFLMSTPFTEKFSLKKYPLYQEYCKITSSIVPWFAGDWSPENAIGKVFQAKKDQ